MEHITRANAPSDDENEIIGIEVILPEANEDNNFMLNFIDAELSDISFTSGMLDPDFESYIYEYSVSVTPDIDSIDITATLSD